MRAKNVNLTPIKEERKSSDDNEEEEDSKEETSIDKKTRKLFLENTEKLKLKKKLGKFIFSGNHFNDIVEYDFDES